MRAAPAGRAALAAPRPGHGAGRGGRPDDRAARAAGSTACRRSSWPGTPTPGGPGRCRASVFWPVPNVDSGLVAFTRRDPAGRGGAAGGGVRGGRRGVRAAAQDAPGGPGRLGRSAAAARSRILRGQAGDRPGARGRGTRAWPSSPGSPPRAAAYDRGIVTAVTARVPAKVNLQLSVGPPRGGWLPRPGHRVPRPVAVRRGHGDAPRTRTSVVVTGRGRRQRADRPGQPGGPGRRRAGSTRSGRESGTRPAWPSRSASGSRSRPAWPAAARTRPAPWSPATRCGAPGCSQPNWPRLAARSGQRRGVRPARRDRGGHWAGASGSPRRWPPGRTTGCSRSRPSGCPPRRSTRACDRLREARRHASSAAAPQLTPT